MKVLVLGAGGKTGKLVVQEALAAGHEVTVLVHTDPQEEDKHEAVFPSKVQVFRGDVRNPTKLRQALEGQQAVIDTIGGTKPFLTTDLETSAIKVVIEAMKQMGTRRLIAVSALGEGESRGQTSFFYERLLMPTFLRGVVEDKANMEAEIEHSGLEFVIVRPSLLNDHAVLGEAHVALENEKAHKISRGGLARFLVEQLTLDRYLGEAVTLTEE
jgi:putative NADH-flavin reductase